MTDEAITASDAPNTRPQAQQDAPPPDQIFAPGAPSTAARTLPTSLVKEHSIPGHGRRSRATAIGRTGHTIGAARPGNRASDIALAATLRAAALRRSTEVRQPEDIRIPGAREKNENKVIPLAGLLQRDDLRIKVRQTRTGNLILFVVDASGSMGARKRMVAVKGAVLSLLIDAYQKRDKVGLITFRGQGAEVLVPPTNSVELAERSLRQVPTGGRTPLVAGLHLAGQILALHLKREAALSPLLVLVTDGRANVGQAGQLQQAVAAILRAQPTTSLVLDSEQGYVRLGTAREIARQLGAKYVRLDDLHSETITQRVRQNLMIQP